MVGPALLPALVDQEGGQLVLPGEEGNGGGGTLIVGTMQDRRMACVEARVGGGQVEPVGDAAVAVVEHVGS